MKLAHLPRLLYLGDVPVDATVGGSALIYRLLQKYPASKLLIVEGNTTVSQTAKRLVDVNYQVIQVGSKRLLHSRLTPLYNAYLLFTAPRLSSQLIQLAQDFQPEAILTVAHGFSWLTAAKLAQYLSLPLHLIVHDDIIAHTPVPSWYRRRFEQQLQKVYCQGRSRLCVSPCMMEAYGKRYGVDGDVLYPCRSPDIPSFELPPPRQSTANHANQSLIFAYAGSIHTPGQAQTLVSLATVLQKFDSQLHIYSTLTAQSAVQIGLDLTNVTLHSLIPSPALIASLRMTADVLFAPMDFEPRYKTHMQLCFPSKLTDYTAIGLPILIWAPAYGSMVRWARENPGTVEVVANPELQALTAALKKLHQDPQYRYQLGQKVLEVGNRYFAYETIVNKFQQLIQQ